MIHLKWNVQPGDVLVADMTDPNWEPVMKRASAIVTNRGGPYLPCGDYCARTGRASGGVVSCDGCSERWNIGQMSSCAEGDEGKIYDGLLETGGNGRVGVATCPNCR